MSPTDVHDDVEAYAIGALDDVEHRSFERHLADCADCRSQVSTYLPVIKGLAQIPTTFAPPPPVVRASKPARIRRVLVRTAALATAAALLIAIGIGAATLRRPTTDFQLISIAGMLADGPRTVALEGPKTRARGRVIVGHRTLRTAFVVRGLPTPPPGKVYHVWVTGAADRLVGTLVPAREHLSVLLVDGNLLLGTRRVAISLESTEATAHPEAPVLVGNV